MYQYALDYMRNMWKCDALRITHLLNDWYVKISNTSLRRESMWPICLSWYVVSSHFADMILSIGPLKTKSSGMWIKMRTICSKKKYIKCHRHQHRVHHCKISTFVCWYVRKKKKKPTSSIETLCSLLHPWSYLIAGLLFPIYFMVSQPTSRVTFVWLL